MLWNANHPPSRFSNLTKVMDALQDIHTYFELNDYTETALACGHVIDKVVTLKCSKAMAQSTLHSYFTTDNS